MAYSSVHLNGNLLCAIDVETSGPRPLYHDILQIALVPVAPDLTVSKQFPYLELKIRPARPERTDGLKNGLNTRLFHDCMANGMPAETAEERLREWFWKLGLPERKKIIPLGHNYSNFDRLFILDWLGGALSYDEFFRSDSRDTMFMALMLNDMADYFSERIPFPKWSLPFLAAQLGVEHPNAHDAVADCIACIECYRKLMRYREHCYKSVFMPPIPPDMEKPTNEPTP